MKNSQKGTAASDTKGFTLIELLVVIAIIGILATIILASLGDARSKANDAKVQDQLSSMRAQAELFYTNLGYYGVGTGLTGCATPPSGSLFAAGSDSLYVLLHGIPSGYATICDSYPASAHATAWSVAAQNSTVTTAWCVDSNGDSKVYTATSTPVAAGGTYINSATGLCN